MDRETKRRIKITIIGIIGFIVLVSGFSYAAFRTDITGIEVQSINSGCLKVDMSDNGALSLTNKAPQTDESGLNEAPYTYTLTNTCSVDAYYVTTINVMNDSNLDNVSKIKVALDGDSYLAPTFEGSLSETELVDTSETGVSKTYKLDEGYLAKGETKTFNLRTWIDYDVESISGSLANKLIVLSEAKEGVSISYKTNTAAYSVLSKNDIITNASYRLISPSDTQTSGAIKTGTSTEPKYYFRGSPNNYISFASKDFRVLSTNGDGSINIVLDSIYSNQTYANVTSNLTSFYSTISGEEKYIKTDQKYCEEKTNTGDTYVAVDRVTNYKPTYTCESGNYMTKIGLVSADDLMYAGAKTGTANTSFYLSASSGYYTNTYKSSNTLYSYATSNSLSTTTNTTSNGVKPVITLKANTIIKGEGTSANKFYVSGSYDDINTTYNDTTAPTIVEANVDDRWTNTNKQIEISAKDNVEGSGIAGYIIKTSNTTPSATDSGWEASSAQKYATIQTYDNGTYYAFVKDNNGNISTGKKVVVSKVDKTAPTCSITIDPSGTETTYKTLSVTSTDANLDKTWFYWDHLGNTKTDVIKARENGVYKATVKDLAGNKGSCTATVTTITTYPNEPVLSDNMIPVYYDETAETWKKADSTNKSSTYKWYDYNDKMWANSVTVSSTNRSTYLSASLGTEIPMDDILTMQVWVPRYKYKVWNYNADGTAKSSPQEIKITFEKGTATTGEISCSDSISGTDGAVSETCKLKSDNLACTDSTCNGKTYTHPAFTFGTEQLEGIWVGKFETTGTISDITIKPDLSSLRNQNVSAFESNIMAMNDSGNKFGFATTVDTHMMKNQEWGAVAYLSHSKYGINKEININNSSSFYTGRSGGNVGGQTPINGTYTDQTSTTQYNSYGFYTYDGYLLNYNTNTKSSTKDMTKIASTTGNIYGIYDMSGGAYEYVMGNIVSNDGTTMMSGYSTSINSGYTGIIYDSGSYTSYTGISYPENKYLDKYSFGTSSTQRIRSKLGDALKEVYNTENYGWYTDGSYLAYSSFPWIRRGGYYSSGSIAGVFYSDSSSGDNSKSSSRLVITP